jgi:2',3'-cyclic-nucleotide 2'-phosphodiesterase (5'-nucleotidase family)
MIALRKFVGITVALMTLGVLALAAETTDTTPQGQSIADLLKDTGSADGAFIAAGLLKDSSDNDNLASALQYPTDEVVIVALRGAQIKQAFERALNFYPNPSNTMLHISGFEVTFSSTAESGKRIVSITAGGAKLDESRTYNIAMPSQLGRGGFGYFKVWDKSNISRTLANTTVESICKGKKLTTTKSRWTAQP